MKTIFIGKRNVTPESNSNWEGTVIPLPRRFQFSQLSLPLRPLPIKEKNNLWFLLHNGTGLQLTNNLIAQDHILLSTRTVCEGFTTLHLTTFICAC